VNGAAWANGHLEEAGVDEELFGGGLKEEFEEGEGFAGVGSAGELGDGAGDEERALAVLVRKDDFDGAVVSEGGAGVVGVGPTGGDVATGDEVADDGVAVDDEDAAVVDGVVESAGGFGAEGGVEGGGLGGGGAEEGLRDGEFGGGEAVGGEVLPGGWGLGGSEFAGVDEDDAEAGSDGEPEVVRVFQVRGEGTSTARVGRLEHAFLVEAKGLDELAVPKDVGLGAGAFGDDAAGEAGGFGGFDVEDGTDVDASAAFEGAEDLLGVDLVDGDVNDEFTSRRSGAAGGQDGGCGQEEGSQRRAKMGGIAHLS